MINLTRKILPKMTYNPALNLKNLRSMPEMVLNRKITQGSKNILHIGMNECESVVIQKGGINTVFTDALNGCNSVGAVVRMKDGSSLFCLSHYYPTNTEEQTNAIKSQLEKYKDSIDTTSTPKLFFNIRGYNDMGRLVAVDNPILEKVTSLFSTFFQENPTVKVTPYLNKGRPAYFSSANIFQFNPRKLSELKITNVGEKESYINLLG